MKKCPQCYTENADAMNFCLQCGAALPQIVINLQNDPPPTQVYREPPSTNPGKNQETAFNNQSGFTPNYQIPPPQQQKPRSNTKLFLILGGLFAMFLLVILGGVAVIAYNIFSSPKTVANNNSAMPTPRVVSSPNTSASSTPFTMPNVNPNVNPSVKPTGATAKLPTGASIKFDRTWVDYNVTEGGRTGMKIHNKFSVVKMKNIECYLAVYFQKEDGTHLTSEDTSFRSQTGNLALFRLLKPNYDNTIYEDVELFMPYGEITIPEGKHNLKLDVDLITKDGQLIQHMNFHNFQYERFTD